MKTTESKITPANFKLIEGTADLNAAIAKIASASKKYENAVHTLAVSVLVHADRHGDITVAQRFIDSLTTMARKNTLRDWLIAFGKFEYNAKEKALTFAKHKVTQTTLAIESPFWSWKQEERYVPFDLQKAIQSLYQRANKAREKGEVVDEKTMKQLASLIAPTETKEQSATKKSKAA